ncbi:ethanolamine ammonia-lyase subunit EutC [Mesobacillus harenae]|uniref:ethanolamine ammonia-lyase subunit EutC n=1 Tax=Mesobacillus harenae TaxID=2213203 RepID=UPI00158063E8|nr:ethanolamine ammonia-lyase subunit EutC [Mesobacillus harenae]
MNPELIEKVTQLIVEKLQAQNGSEAKKPQQSDLTAPEVKLWGPSSSLKPKSEKLQPITVSDTKETVKSTGLIEFRSYAESKSSSSGSKPEPSPRKAAPVTIAEEDNPKAAEPVSGIEDPSNPEELEDLISQTPARIGVGRAGLRPKTNTWLKFRFDHAAAVDAVYGDVTDELLDRLDLFKVGTRVSDKEVYIRRPDYGRKLSDEALKTLAEKCKKSPTVQIIVSDGLSSSAIEENVEDVYLSLKQSLTSLNLDTGTPFYIEKGRVAVMDDIGELLQPKVVVLLIGERPGLVSAESLSAYLCYMPRRGTIEADRMVISNIHKGGIPPVEAGAYIGTIVQKILKYEASGVSLVQKES